MHWWITEVIVQYQPRPGSQKVAQPRSLIASSMEYIVPFPPEIRFWKENISLSIAHSLILFRAKLILANFLFLIWDVSLWISLVDKSDIDFLSSRDHIFMLITLNCVRISYPHCYKLVLISVANSILTTLCHTVYAKEDFCIRIDQLRKNYNYTSI
jgi:hypothetical protein